MTTTATAATAAAATQPRTGTDPLTTYLAYGEAEQAPSGHAGGEPGAGSAQGLTAVSPFGGAPEAVHGRIVDRVEAARDDLRALAVALFEDPEVGFEEHRSVARIAELLAAGGHQVETGSFGLPTAFRASVGSRAPHFAIVAEYDALPGIGHACGHNIIAAVAAGSFAALAPEVAALGGRLSIIGTPAEEGGGGKEHVLRAGGFDGVDAAGMVHPSVGSEVSPIYGSGTSGVRRLRVRYHGRAGHAAASPHLGLNALDAVVTAYQSIAQLRQHILPIDRIHGIITNDGAAANVVPDLTEAEFLVRSSEIDTLKVLTERVIDALEAAALATGTTAEIDVDFEPPYLPLKPNVLLTKHWARRLETRGRAVPLTPARVRLGGPSTDMGNVSWAIPAVHPALGLGGPADVAPHNAAFAESTVEPPAIDALVDAAIALAGLAADYLADGGLRAAVREEFDANGGVRRWTS